MNGKQLKNSILQWAIQGKLVPQDPNDEPASVLLERIRAEKARLVKEGRIKKDKNESIIFRGEDNSHYEKFQDGRVICIDDEIPFEVPKGWEWARMSSLSSVIHYGFTASARLSGNAKLLRITDIQDGKVQWDDVPFCEIDKKGLCNYQLENDDIVIARTGGTVGKSFVISDISVVAVFASYLIRIKPVPGIYIPYIATYLESPCYWRQLTDATSGTGQPNVNGQSLSNLLVPIPPFDEQKRIIVERNSIYPLLQKYSTAQDRLDALNESLRGSLKKSVLQEAIQGRLVPQDPKEKPASVLLEQICEEKRKLLKEGKLKKKDLVDSTIIKGEDNKYYEKVAGKTLEISEEIPFDIPESWAWVRLGSVVTNEAGLAYSKDCLTDRSQPLIRVLRGGNIEEGRWSIKDDDVIISKKYVKDSLLLKRGTFITPAVTSIERMAKTALIQEDHHDIVVGGFVLMIKPVIIDNALLQYLNLFFQTTYYKKYCISITNKSGQAFYNLSRQKLMQCLVPIPPEKEQFRIADKYSQLTL